jgi:hypothetical protein
MQKMIGNYIYTPPCDGDSLVAGKDTLYVYNPKIIAHVIADSSLLNHKGKGTKGLNNVITFRDSLKTDTLITGKVDTSGQKTNSDSLDLKKEKFRSFKYYPNPTSGPLTIEIDGELEEIYLADISGKLLMKYLVSHEGLIKIDIGRFPTGLYLLGYQSEKKWMQGKVVLRH